jgi:glycosyltransferase involved in cell wall biosynthesis
MKTLIVDGQILQTNAFFRGMGGYTYNVIKTFAEQQPDVQLLVMLNIHMLHDEERMAAIQAKMPTAKLHLLDLPFQPGPDLAHEAKARQALDAFIAAETPLESNEVYYFLPALFLFDYCAVFPTNVKKLLLFHDLTPLIFREDLAKYFPAHLYFPRFKTIFEADIVYTNSQTTGRDLEQYLGISPDKLINIDGSLNMQSREEQADARDILKRLNLDKTPFLLMPTGGTEFKNNIRAAQALANLKRGMSVDIKVAVTSFFRQHEQEELRMIAGDDLVFTGNISNSELTTLYESCDAVLLPSLYEGLGIPVLEGIEHDKPVACSDIAVFREIPHCQEALYMFDPYDVEEIGEAMLRAVSHAGFEQKRTHYPAILQKYSWSRTAELFAEALADPKHFVTAPVIRKRIAVLCPDPRKNNDVAVFAQRMFGYARRENIELVYFIDPGGDDDPTATILSDYVRSVALTYDIKDFLLQSREQKFDEVISFLSSDTRFPYLMRYTLGLDNGYVYVGNEGYRALIEQLADRQMISADQAVAEAQLYEQARAAGAFETVSVLGRSKGVIVEKHVTKRLRKALELFNLTVQCLELPECSIINFDRDAVELQPKAYHQVLSFIEGKQ